MVPSPALDKIRGIMIDRRVRLDIVGNVLHSLCDSLQRSAGNVLELV